MNIPDAVKILKEVRITKEVPQRFATGVAILAKYAPLKPIGNDDGVLFPRIFLSTIEQISEIELQLLGACGFTYREGNSEDGSWQYSSFVVDDE